MRRGGARPVLALGLGLGLGLGLAAGRGVLAADYDYGDYDYDYEDACESVKPGAQMRARCDSVGGESGDEDWEYDQAHVGQFSSVLVYDVEGHEWRPEAF